jgi:membrane protein DedA with SNARE-associated domain
VDVASAGLLVVVGLILVKEAGLPVPVPGDLVVIGAGVAASRGDLDPVTTLALIVVASIVGGAVQYALVRSVGRPILLRVLGRLTSAERLDRQTERLRRGGVRSVAVARSTPGVRIVAIAASALAAIPPVAFVAGLAIGNALFIAAHFGLGYVLGEPLLAAVGDALGPLAVAGLVLAALGGIGWLVLSRRRARAQTDARSGGTSLAAIAAWADACCPACLALAVVDRRDEEPSRA